MIILLDQFNRGILELEEYLSSDGVYLCSRIILRLFSRVQTLEYSCTILLLYFALWSHITGVGSGGGGGGGARDARAPPPPHFFH